MAPKSAGDHQQGRDDCVWIRIRLCWDLNFGSNFWFIQDPICVLPEEPLFTFCVPLGLAQCRAL